MCIFSGLIKWVASESSAIGLGQIEPVKGNPINVESVEGERLRAVVGVAINLTEITRWVMKERSRVRSPRLVYSCIVISLTPVSPAFEIGRMLMGALCRCMLVIL